MQDRLNTNASLRATLMAGTNLAETLIAHGVYAWEHRDAAGNLLGSGEFPNTVATVGMNQILTAALGGGASSSAFMGLISSSSYSATVAGDTMGSHSGWLEAGVANAPTFAARLALTWAASGSGAIATNSTNTFTMTGSGTIEGGFVVFGSGASATIANTGGVLLSAGVITTPQPVISGNTFTLSYTLTL